MSELVEKIDNLKNQIDNMKEGLENTFKKRMHHTSEPGTYSGRYDRRSFEEYLKHFNKWANANDLTVEDCVRRLPIYLVGDAARVYDSLPNARKNVWKTLCDILAERFKRPEYVEKLIEDLNERKQNR